MNQYQNRSSEEQKTFLSRIKDNYSATFGNLSITNSIQKASSHVDKDGDSENKTLIHTAFVRYFDSKGEAYPEWLGEAPKTGRGLAGRGLAGSYGSLAGTYGSVNGSYSGQNSQYKPVYGQYNSSTVLSQRPQPLPTQSAQGSFAGNLADGGSSSLGSMLGSTYKPRSSSRLQDMYNKSRQQQVPGGGYTTVSHPNRSNSSTSGSRLRERMMHSNSMTGMSSHIDGRRG